jgi:hypothetical protein
MPDRIERFAVGDVVNNGDSVRTVVIRSGDCVETFLSGGIPDLQFDGVGANFDRFDFLELEKKKTKSTPIVLKYLSEKVFSV